MILSVMFFWSAGIGQVLDKNVHHFGKLKDWNNPLAVFLYTNISTQTQSFLPIAYMEDISVSFEKDKVLPGETVEVYVRYYTESFGRFEKKVDFYVNTEAQAMELMVDGKIVSFHPDAFSYCPRADGRSEEFELGFIHEVEVRDIKTNEVLIDYSIVLNSASQNFKKNVGEKDLERGRYVVKKMRPNLFEIKVKKEGYVYYEQLHYINRNSGLTRVYLSQDPDHQVDPELEDAIVKDNSDTLFVPVDSIVEVEVVEEITIVADSNEIIDNGSLNNALFNFNHIVFVIDVSASMRKEEKLPLLKYSMAKLIEVLRENDRVTIITYSSSVNVVVDNLSGANKEAILDAILALEAKGSSYGSEALNSAYDLAKEHFLEDGNNELILASDGLFNSSDFKEGKVYRKAWWNYKKNNLRLSTIAFGKSKSALDFMEKSANYGGGNYIQIPDKTVASEVLVQNIMEHSKK